MCTAPVLRIHVSNWHKAESFGSATTQAAMWEYKRHAKHLDLTPGFDPELTMPWRFYCSAMNVKSASVGFLIL
jgi:hypothetical protein